MKWIAWIQTMMLSCSIIVAFTSINTVVTCCAIAISFGSVVSLCLTANALHAQAEADRRDYRIAREHVRGGLALVVVGVTMLIVGLITPQAQVVNLVLILTMVWAGIGLMFERHN